MTSRLGPGEDPGAARLQQGVVVGVEEVEHRGAEQVVLLAPDEPLVRRVDLQVQAVGRVQGHAERRMVEGQTEPLLGVAAGECPGR